VSSSKTLIPYEAAQSSCSAVMPACFRQCWIAWNGNASAIEPFRDRGFLAFLAETDPIVAISHESPIRLWDKLETLVQSGSDSASRYTRLWLSVRAYNLGTFGAGWCCRSGSTTGR
jgi:hypothetical protein